MLSPAEVLAPRISAAIAAAFGTDFRDVDPVLRPSQFADLQANAALPLAKRVGMAPREVALKVLGALDVADVCRQVEISGPGFINLTLDEGWLAQAARDVAVDARLGVPVDDALTIPIDYSSPNVAKEMHVGHLRTTVVGDSLARTLEHLGHRVVRQNHVGDWGTPFGMLIEHLLDVGVDSPDALLLETDPNAFYQGARLKFDADAGFAGRARVRVVALQSGDAETLRLWEALIELSKHYFNRIYAALNVTLTDGDLAGESTFSADLPVLCEELERRGIAVESDGALCVFLDEFTGRDGTPMPLIVRKSDGGYNYATTDLAMVRRCVREFGADRILYVVGAPQALHFQMVFATARKAGWLPDLVTPVHVQIGNVLGPDRKLLRTRSGDPLRLMALIDEAVENARHIIDATRPDLDEDTRAAVAVQVGVGAVKYADLSVAHDSEYVFDLERMLSLTGNTAVYLQYAVARIRNIFRQGGLDRDEPRHGILVAEPGERSLALALVEFGSVVGQAGRELEPHRLCGYLFDLAQTFSVFYESCPVLQSEGQVRESRLALCALTLRVLVQGLDLLGVVAPEQM